jgi:hypothetical protein
VSKQWKRSIFWSIAIFILEAHHGKFYVKNIDVRIYNPVNAQVLKDHPQQNIICDWKLFSIFICYQDFCNNLEEILPEQITSQSLNPNKNIFLFPTQTTPSLISLIDVYSNQFKRIILMIYNEIKKKS